jgi:hypothetical protein
MRCIFTICAKNYLARARVLMASVRRHEPDARRLVVLSDRVDGYLDPGAEDFEILEIERLPIADLRALCFRYDIMELATAVKPSVLRHLLAGGCDEAIYLDPDTRLYRPLVAVTQALRAGATGALTPHALEPLPPRQLVGNAVLQRAGAYNLGFVALTPAPEVLAALRWWEERLRHYCRRDQSAAGEFVDQKWMDLWPLLCPGTALLRDPGLNVAYWNLDQRPLRRRGDTWYAGEAPLTFLHFSGFNPGPPMVVSQHRRDLDEAGLGVGAELFHHYAASLQRADLAGTQDWPYAFGQFRDGRPLPFVLRQFHREVLEPCLGDPFDSACERFAELPGGGGTDQPVTRLMAFLLERNEGLARHFRLDEPLQRAAYWRWFLAEAATYFSLPRWLIEATASAHGRLAARAAAS